MSSSNTSQKENFSEQANDYIESAQEKLTNFVNDAKSGIDEALQSESAQNLKEKASDLTTQVEEYASLAEEKISDFIEDTPEEVQEVVKKGKNFFQRLFGK